MCVYFLLWSGKLGKFLLCGEDERRGSRSCFLPVPWLLSPPDSLQNSLISSLNVPETPGGSSCRNKGCMVPLSWLPLSGEPQHFLCSTETSQFSWWHGWKSVPLHWLKTMRWEEQLLQRINSVMFASTCPDKSLHPFLGVSDCHKQTALRKRNNRNYL